MKLESTMSAKGQITLPKAVREALGLVPGDRVVYRFSSSGVLIMRVGRLRDVAGRLAHPKQPPQSLEEMDEAIAKAAACDALLSRRLD